MVLAFADDNSGALDDGFILDLGVDKNSAILDDNLVLDFVFDVKVDDSLTLGFILG